MTIATRKFGDAPFGGTASEEMNDVIQANIPPVKKRYLYKIYSSTGVFIDTWNDVINDPSFSVSVNSGYSELTLQLARNESNYDEGVSVKYGNQIKVYAFDRNSIYDGNLIYSGILSQYVPSVDGANETITVTFLSYWWDLNNYLLEDGAKTLKTYTAQDPTDVLKDLLDKFTAAGGKLDYSPTSTVATGTTITYTFNTATYQEAILKVLELSPASFNLRIGADDVVYFKEYSATAEHTFTLGKDIISYQPEKRIENIVNKVYFVGGDMGGGTILYKKYTEAGSVTAYGVHAIKYVDERVITTSTADIIANRIINQFKDPEIRVIIKVMDNNGDAYQLQKGYDIESIKVGDTCQIRNATSKGKTYWDIGMWDLAAWDYDIAAAASIVLNIVKVDYTPDYVTLELSNRQPDITKKIEDINKKFVDSLTITNPDTPTT